MTRHVVLDRHAGLLEREDDFAGWRSAARRFLLAGVPPERIDWQVADAASVDLFAGEALPLAEGPGAVQVSRDLLRLLRHALLHSAPERFALGYRLLWRVHHDPSVQRDPADPDMIAIGRLAKAVRRDIHKMHAFIRFRKLGEAGGREQFAAWFEPDHHIGRAVAGFFRDRFTGMDWLIVTPEVSIAWNGTTLTDGPGGERSDVPAEDAVEAEWKAYYTHIFNPARLKVAMMKREMPVRYWRNLPEAALIADLVSGAGQQMEAMVERTAKTPDLTLAMPEPARTFPSLAALYAALKREDEPPSAGFSDVIVPGEGPVGAGLMFVGEQPGDQEDLAGRPFVGPAGQLLDESLERAGIDRRDVFMTNAVKRFKFAPRGKRRMHQTPNAGDIAHYRWWLAEEIRLVRPKLVVALGATALQALTGRKQALAPIRGTIMPGQDGHDLLVTVHPSFLLRLPDEQGRRIEREKFVRDLAVARAAA